MESKFDWLTLTIKPEKPTVTFDECFSVLACDLFLGDLIGKMELKGRFAFYDYALTYENIIFCYTEAERFVSQGICIRISSQGLDYFTRYINTYGITFKQWLGKWRSLCFDGYITKDTRIDYAMDDIHFNGEKPVLTMKKVLDCSRRGELRKRGRVVDLYDGDGVTVKERYKIVNKEPVIGRTLNVGSRQSEVYCRFYDKLAEQLQKKESVPEGCTSWTRCEFEIKGSAAMCVLNAFLDFGDVDFSKYMRGVVNNYVSFIVRNNNNISRCPIKRWWAKFLGGCTEKFKLSHKAPARSAYARACRGLHKYVPTIYTMFQELGLEGVYRFFEEEINNYKRTHSEDKIYKKELAENIREGVRDYEEMTAYKMYLYNSFELDSANDDDFIENVKRYERTYFHLKYKAEHMDEYEKQRHQQFMNGCEVLY